ncbi:MAG: hypothetical protein AABZ94_05270 [Candidatus Eisenbacteria bacterium]
MSQVTNGDVNDILNYLVPMLGGDTVPPAVEVTTPNGGQSWTGGTAQEYGTLGGGAHRITWDGRGASGGEASTGIYWTAIQAGDTRLVRQVVKVK